MFAFRLPVLTLLAFASVAACAGNLVSITDAAVLEEQISPVGSLTPQQELAISERAMTDRQRISLSEYRSWRTQLFEGEVDAPDDMGLVPHLNQQIDVAKSDFERSLFMRVRLEQVGRLDWSEQPGQLVEKFTSRGLGLDPADENALNEILMLEFVQADAENTTWLKQQLAERADLWWTISEVGEFTSFIIWLLVQHADADQAFQQKALALMEPLVANGEVSASNFAYLYDRVNSPQRYGTQLHCVDGAYVPRSLEDPERVDELRESAGLGPMADYLSLPSLDSKNCQIH